MLDRLYLLAKFRFSSHRSKYIYDSNENQHLQHAVSREDIGGHGSPQHPVLNKFCTFLISPNLRFAINLHELVRYIMRGFLLSSLSSIFHVSIKYSNPNFLIICPRYLNFLLLMLSKSLYFVYIFSVEQHFLYLKLILYLCVHSLNCQTRVALIQEDN